MQWSSGPPRAPPPVIARLAVIVAAVCAAASLACAAPAGAAPRMWFGFLGGHRRSFLFHVAALELRWHLSSGARVGITYSVAACGRTVTEGQEAARIASDGWVPVPLDFAASPTTRYVVSVRLEDIHGFRVSRTINLVPASGATRCVGPLGTD